MEEKKTILESTLERYRGTAGAGDQQALIALLREVQQLYGCVPTVIQQRIAQCGNAPNVMIDSTIHPSVRPEQVSAIIDQYS